MKRLLALLVIAALLWTSSAHAFGLFTRGGFSPKSYSGVALNIATVAGGAFISNPTGGAPSTPSISAIMQANPNRFIAVCSTGFCTSPTDCAGADGAACAWGYIGPPGTGETTGSSIITSWNNGYSGANTFSTWNSSGTTITEAGTSSSGPRAIGNNPSTVGYLLKWSFTFTLNSGTVPNYGACAIDGSNITGLGLPVAGANAGHWTTDASNHLYMGFRTTAAADFTVGSYANDRALSPSLTGIWLKSTQAGAADNTLAGIGASFNPGASSMTAIIVGP